MFSNPALVSSLAEAARTLLESDFNLWTTTRRLHALMGCDGCSHAALDERVSAAAPVMMAVE
jgi:hypothetical protein